MDLNGFRWLLKTVISWDLIINRDGTLMMIYGALCGFMWLHRENNGPRMGQSWDNIQQKKDNIIQHLMIIYD